MRRLRDVTPDEVERAGQRWVASRSRYSKQCAGPTSVCYFRWVARGWFQFLGRLRLPPPESQPFSRELADYVARMKTELGYAPEP
jgi:hypothetical protein